MDKQPTEARQDELAGIREKLAKLQENLQNYGCWQGVFDPPVCYRADLNCHKCVADHILDSLTVSSGGICPECKGEKKISKENGRDAVGDVYTEIIDCPTCNGMGQKPIVTKTLGEIIKEWKNGN